MKLDDCYQLGYIVKKHGLKGELNIYLDVDNPEYYNKLESVFVLVGANLVPFFIEHIQLKGKKATLSFEDVNEAEEADKLIGCELYLPLSQLPELKGKSFYFHEIVDFTLIDKSTGKTGIVKGVNSAGHQDLLIADFNGTEVLVPLLDQLIVEIDRKNEQITMNFPVGLLDIYLSEDEN